jgi:L-lactate dehydrogenase
VLDPRAFAGLSAFEHQMDEMTRRCHASRPAQAGRAVRLPGERGLQLKQAATQQGVALHPSILPMLEPWAQQYGIAMLQPL